MFVPLRAFHERSAKPMKRFIDGQIFFSIMAAASLLAFGVSQVPPALLWPTTIRNFRFTRVRIEGIERKLKRFFLAVTVPVWLVAGEPGRRGARGSGRPQTDAGDIR